MYRIISIKGMLLMHWQITCHQMVVYLIKTLLLSWKWLPCLSYRIESYLSLHWIMMIWNIQLISLKKIGLQNTGLDCCCNWRTTAGQLFLQCQRGFNRNENTEERFLPLTSTLIVFIQLEAKAADEGSCNSGVVGNRAGRWGRWINIGIRTQVRWSIHRVCAGDT